MTVVLGVDGDKQGWIGVVLVDGVFEAAALAVSLEDVVASLPDKLQRPDAVAIDMPIGWCGQMRACDQRLRARLPGKASTVFNAPPAVVLTATTYRDANEGSKAETGKGISAQSWMLVPKIKEATSFSLDSGLPVIEAHPEWSFALMTGGAPAEPSKKSWVGHRERTGRLAGVGIEVPDDLGEAGAAGIEDVLDAAAVAWTAHRWTAGEACRLEEPPANVVAGGHVAIWG